MVLPYVIVKQTVIKRRSPQPNFDQCLVLIKQIIMKDLELRGIMSHEWILISFDYSRSKRWVYYITAPRYVFLGHFLNTAPGAVLRNEKK